ncbi:MAG: response regulator [Paludibaculum sp.]
MDDSMFLRRRVREALQDQHSVQEAANGRLALLALAQGGFECVVTDLMMPELDGIGLLAAIREQELNIPVVVMTADIQKTTRSRCEELGAQAFLNKPVNLAELRNAVASVLATETPR